MTDEQKTRQEACQSEGLKQGGKKKTTQTKAKTKIRIKTSFRHKDRGFQEFEDVPVGKKRIKRRKEEAPCQSRNAAGGWVPAVRMAGSA